MGKVFHLLYTSHANSTITPVLIQAILKSARRHNQADNITGFLVARDGYFLQLLEGEEAKVRACYARISKDMRHSSLTVQGEVYSDLRIMPDWTMGEVQWSEDLSSSESLVEIFELGRGGELYRKPESLLKLLQKFGNNAKIVA